MTAAPISAALPPDAREVDAARDASDLPWGTLRAAGSNAPLLLDDPSVAWKVIGGGMDIFAVPVRHGAIDGPREFLFQVGPGTVLPGFGYDTRGRTTLMAVGGTDSGVVPLDMATLREYVDAHPVHGPSIVEPVVRGVAGAFVHATRSTRRLDQMADDEGVSQIPAGTTLGVRRDVRWVQVVQRGIYILDADSTALGANDAPFPLAPGAWLTADEEGGTVVVEAHDTMAVIASGRLWDSLDAFRVFTVEWAARVRRREEAVRVAQLRARMAADSGSREEALSAMASVMSAGSRPDDRRKGIPLLAAMELVGSAMDVRFRMPGSSQTFADPYGGARAIADASSVGCRRVLLDHMWWTRESGPLLGILELRQLPTTTSPALAGEMERVPVALLPAPGGGYVMVNPETGSRSPVDADIVRHLSAFAVQFYRGLPTTPVRLADIWKFVTHGVRSDARVLLLVGIFGAFFGLILPLLTSYLFDDVIPSADRGGLVAVGVALVVATCSGALFEITRTISVTRLHTRMTTALQLAVIDRLVRLPATFFRDYNAGDLGRRAMGVYTIGQALGGSTISAVLSTVVSGSALVLLFYYSVPLALACCGVLAVNVITSVVVSRRSLRYARRQQAAAGELAGLMLELLHGISKLRVAAAEPRAFARWSAAFAEQRQLAFSVGLFALNLEAFYAFLGIGANVLLYGIYAWMAASAATALTTGQFLAFASAQGTFLGAGLSLSETAIGLLGLLPIWERAKPLLDAVPETDFLKPDPGVLTGHIEVNQLRFAYQSDGPPILHDLSLSIEPGTFVALVGPSGSGKSTLLRILLGFEKQQSGSVRFDGQELTAVDVSAVRRQIGVVLQNASLTAGDVFSNIVGASPLTQADAWEAARMAGMDDDLRAMPMGMSTLITDGGGTLSGGQRQRLLIARALATRPRILFFDEATSALDNHTQRIVSESIERLNATRVVVAHRLSTVRHADRILVLDAGRVVEAGNYEELMANGGLFASMAARQGT